MENRECNAAVVGLGYWGPNLVRNFTASPHWNVGWVVDIDERQLRRIQRLYPGCHATTQLDAALSDPSVDLVAVAVPPALHVEVAKRAIHAGKHVLVEKPLAESSADAAMLMESSAGAGVKLFTDHTFLYTGAVETMRRLHASAELGDIYYAESQRVNLGLFQQSNVVWDLAPHDISILNYVFGALPEAIACHAQACIDSSVWDVAFMHLRYRNGCVAQVHLSWLSPVKVRRMMLSASTQMLLWDDVDPSEKLRIYDKGIVRKPTSETLEQQMISYRLGDVRIPVIDGREALGKLVDDVWAAIRQEKSIRVGGLFGYDVVRSIEAACQSAHQDGRWVRLSSSLRGTTPAPADQYAVG